jgi:hypothetical protein
VIDVTHDDDGELDLGNGLPSMEELKHRFAAVNDGGDDDDDMDLDAMANEFGIDLNASSGDED